jgi:branched-chain amino acid transport system substrate-binding protein
MLPRKSHILIVPILILVLIGTLVACAPSAAPPSQAGPKKILVGFTASQTGAQNVASGKQIEGLQLWLDDVTKAGGIKLKDGSVVMPEIKFYDDESKTDRVQALYTQLINEDKADFLISPYSSGLAKAAAVVSEQNGKVMITTGAADDATMEQGFKNIYQLYTPASRYQAGALDLLNQLDPSLKKIAIVYEKDSFSASVANALNHTRPTGLQHCPVRRLRQRHDRLCAVHQRNHCECARCDSGRRALCGRLLFCQAAKRQEGAGALHLATGGSA